MIRRLAFAMLLCSAPSAAAASPVGKALHDLVRQNYPQLHRCYRKVLAVDRARAGTVFIEVALDRRGHPTSLKAARDELAHPPLVRCLEQTVARWSFAAVAKAGAANATVVLPLTFRADRGQFVVHREDAPVWKAAWLAGSRHKSIAELPLLNAKNVGLEAFRLSLVEPPADAQLHCHRRAAQLLIALGPGGVTIGGVTLAKGEAIYLPPGASLRFATSGKGPARLLRVTWPAGPPTQGAIRTYRRGHKISLALGSRQLVIERMRLARRARLAHLAASRTTRAYFVESGRATIAARKQPPRPLQPGSAFVLKAGQPYELRLSSAMQLWALTLQP